MVLLLTPDFFLTGNTMEKEKYPGSKGLLSFFGDTNVG